MSGLRALTAQARLEAHTSPFFLSLSQEGEFKELQEEVIIFNRSPGLQTQISRQEYLIAIYRDTYKHTYVGNCSKGIR